MIDIRNKDAPSLASMSISQVIRPTDYDYLFQTDTSLLHYHEDTKRLHSVFSEQVTVQQIGAVMVREKLACVIVKDKKTEKESICGVQLADRKATAQPTPILELGEHSAVAMELTKKGSLLVLDRSPTLREVSWDAEKNTHRVTKQIDLHSLPWDTSRLIEQIKNTTPDLLFPKIQLSTNCITIKGISYNLSSGD